MEFSHLYSSSNIIRGIKLRNNEIGRACSTCGERRSAHRILVGNPEERKMHGRPKLI